MLLLILTETLCGGHHDYPHPANEEIEIGKGFVTLPEDTEGVEIQIQALLAPHPGS